MKGLHKRIKNVNEQLQDYASEDEDGYLDDDEVA